MSEPHAPQVGDHVIVRARMSPAVVGWTLDEVNLTKAFRATDLIEHSAPRDSTLVRRELIAAARRVAH